MDDADRQLTAELRAMEKALGILADNVPRREGETDQDVAERQMRALFKAGYRLAARGK